MLRAATLQHWGGRNSDRGPAHHSQRQTYTVPEGGGSTTRPPRSQWPELPAAFATSTPQWPSQPGRARAEQLPSDSDWIDRRDRKTRRDARGKTNFWRKKRESTEASPT